jgi:hypothetical protein
LLEQRSIFFIGALHAARKCEREPLRLMRLASNQELYDYLASLAASLRERGAESMAEIITSASRQAAGS